MLTAATESQQTAVAPPPTSLPINSIRENPRNPREVFEPDALEALANDIEQRGVLQPVLVRPVETGFEMIAGHRRLRAAKRAGLDEIPVVVRETTDDEALVIALIENTCREDLHDLDVAAGLKDLTQTHGVTVEDLVQRLGKSRAAIYGLLKLNDLAEKPRALFRENKLNLSTAQLVARVPNPELQEKAAEAIAKGRFDDGPLTFRDAQELLEREYMRQLRDARFDRNDAELCPPAGACVTCPKRTGAQPELYKDVKGLDVCTDPSCFREKEDAWWQRAKDAGRRGEGPKVLPKVEAEEILRHGFLHSNEYVTPDTVCTDDDKRRTYRKLLGKQIKDALVLARDDRGKVHDLLPRKGLKDLLGDAGHRFDKGGVSDAEAREERRKEKERAEIQAEVNDQAMAAIVQKVESRDPDRKFWALLTDLLVEGVGADYAAKRRGLEGSVDEQWIGKARGEQLRGLVLEIALSNLGFNAHFKAACEHFKVDLKDLERTVKADRKEAEKKAEAEKLFRKKAD